ncbi:MAG: carbon-nitrogen hydrolase family protein [Candidatus Heimdallarchaeota archaeon]|nr:carbon-nitrogen hydrolase family protein [Candidatus Heimdallarchaeota archaeon]
MTIEDKLTLLSLQPKTTLHNLDENLENYQQLLDEIDLNQEYAVICFPEYWNGLRIKSYLKTSYQDSISFLQSIALTYTSWVIGGSQIVKNGENYHNRSSIINPQGKIIGTYDKHRLFGYELNQNIIAGKNLFHWKLGQFNASICICNDLWSLKNVDRIIKNDTDVLFVPTLSVVPKKSDTNYGQYIWHNLAFIRAKEGAMAIVVSDTAKLPLMTPFWSSGASCIVDPSKRFSNQESKGKHMIKTLESGECGIIFKTIFLSEIREQRSYRKQMGLM